VAIDRANFDGITENDLKELVEGQVPEGLRLDFKLIVYGRSDADKKELLKDFSALANSHGGHLILGVDEKGGVATDIVGLNGVDPDAEILRMEQLTRSGLEPPVPGVRMKAVSLESGRHVIVIRVPRSWNPPHRVIAQGVNRFYARHSAGVHEPSVEELRTLFVQSASALEQARRFRAERLQFIREGRGERPLVGNGRLILHIVPVAAFSGMVNLDVEAIHAQSGTFRPMVSMGMTPRFNYHGFINERGGDANHGYTQIFRNGILEATKAGIVREREGRRFIPGLAVEQDIFEMFSVYIVGLQDVGVPPPLIIMFTLEGVEGAIYTVEENRWGDYKPPLPENVITLPECVLEDYGSAVDHQKAVRSAFDALWNASGYARSFFFNDEGRWVGDKR
jgi:hypothetical protein